MSDTNTSDAKLIETLREISIQINRDPTAKARFMRVLVGDNTPENIARAAIAGNARNNMPYYREHFAQELLPILDGMIADRRTRAFRYDNFPGIRPRSLYLKVYQSFLYVVDMLDTEDAKYLKLHNETEVTKRRDSVQIRFIEMDRIPLRADTVDEGITKKDWRNKVDQFVDHGKAGEVLLIEKISLSDEEVQDLKDSLLQIPDAALLRIITGTRIKLIKPLERTS